MSEDRLRIDAFRTVPKSPANAHVVRREPRYGALTPTLPLAKGAGTDAITATYEAGVSYIRVPVVVPPAPAVIAIARS